VDVRWQVGEVRDVIPGLAAIHRVVDLSGRAAGPYDTLLDGREREVRDRTAGSKLGSGRRRPRTWRRGRSGRYTAWRQWLTLRRRKVGTESLPRLRAVARDHDAVVTDVHRPRLKRCIKPLPEITRLNI